MSLMRSESSCEEHVNTLTGSPEEFQRKFFTLLESSEQRTVFYKTMRNPKNWPSTTALFGNPPYHFLKLTDRDPIRASAIKKGAKRLSYTTDRLRRSGMPQYTSGNTGVRVLSVRSASSRDGPHFLLKSGDLAILELHVNRESDRLSKRMSLSPVKTLADMFTVEETAVVVRSVLKASKGVVLVAACVV